MAVINKVGMFSLAKYYGLYLAILGVVLSFIIAIVPTPYSTLPIILFLPGILAIFGMVTGLVDAVLYNGLAIGLGGISLDYRDGTIKSVDALSLAKIYAVVNGVWGLVDSGGVAGFIVYAIMGFIAAFAIALMYNLISEEVGGIKVVLKNNVLSSVGWISLSKVVAILLVIGVFVFEIIVGAALVLFPQIGQAVSSTTLVASAIVALAAGLLVLLFALVIGFLATAVEASFYNYFSRKIGGIEVYLDSAKT